MADLNEGDGVLTCSQRFHEAVDAVARQAKDDANAPVNQPLHEDIGRCSRHVSLRVSCVRQILWRVARAQMRPTAGPNHGASDTPGTRDSASESRLMHSSPLT